jgi:hypothetical protein
MSKDLKPDDETDDLQTKSNLEKFFSLKNRKETKQSDKESKGSNPKASISSRVDTKTGLKANESGLITFNEPMVTIPDIRPKTPPGGGRVVSEPVIQTEEDSEPNEVFLLLNKPITSSDARRLTIIDEPHMTPSDRSHITKANGSQNFPEKNENEVIGNLGSQKRIQSGQQRGNSASAIKNNSSPCDDIDIPLNDSCETWYDLNNQSETSIYFKNDYFENNNYYTEKETFGDVKHQLLIKDRMIKNFQSKREVALPKFIKESYRKTKMREILTTKPLDPIRQAELYFDRFPLINFRRSCMKYCNVISHYCYTLVKQKWFDNLSLLVILINTLLILISDPKDNNSIANTSDNYFLYIYTAEMFLKIFAFGFILSEGAYIKDTWNILDFLVIVLGWVSIFLESGDSGGSGVKGIGGLRAFRILRPLKTVKSIKGLRNLIVTILESVGQLGDIAIIMFFSFMIFSIAGVQMWQGLFMYRCISDNTGLVDSFDDWSNSCTFNTDCAMYSSPGEEYSCRKTYLNPYNNVFNYDNVLNGLLTVYQICTMEGWTDIWGYVSRSFKDANGINLIIIFIYFHVLIFLCGYFLINLCLAVIMTFFTEIKSRKEDLMPKKILRKDLQVLYEEQTNDLKLIEEDALENELEKIKKEVGGIEKAEVPFTYYTLRDIYRLYNETPENIDDLRKKILREAKVAIDEFKVKEKKLKEHVQMLKRQITEKTTEHRINKMVNKMMNTHGKSERVDTYSEDLLKLSIKDTLDYMAKISQKLPTNKSPSPARARKTKSSKKKKNDLSYIISEPSDDGADLLGGDEDVAVSESDSFVSNLELGESKADLQNGGVLQSENNFESKESFGDEKFLALVEERANNEKNYDIIKTLNKNKIKISKTFKYSYEDKLFKRSYKTLKELPNLEALHNGATTANIYRRSKSHDFFEDPGFNEASQPSKMDVLFINPRDRRNSITKALHKFPNVDKYEALQRKEEVESHNHIRPVAKHVTSFRKYMSYTYNLLDKDIHIKDDFSVSLNSTDVLRTIETEGRTKMNSQLEIDKADAIRFFNKTKIYNYEYNMYNKYTLGDDEFIHINHSLKHLTPDIITKVGYRTNQNLEGSGLTSMQKTTSSVKSVNSNFSSSMTNLSATMKTSMKTSTKSKSSKNTVLALYNDERTKKLAHFNKLLYMKIDSFNFKTFHKYFDTEERIFMSIKEFETNPEPILNPRDQFDIKREVEKIRQYDLETGVVKHVEWSASDVLDYDTTDDTKYTQWNSQMARLESFDIILWNQNCCIGYLTKFRYFLHKLAVAQWFDIFIITIVIINAVIMAIDGNMLDPDMLVKVATINYAFNAIYILEFIIKFIGLGPFIYMSDPTTYLDLLIIGFAILDMSTNSDGSSGNAVSSKLGFLRVFRIFRVIRLMKVLKKIKTMRLIMSGISESIVNVGYVVLILIMFILIFQLLGMSLLNNVDEYSNFMSSFYTTFNLVTLENWNQLLIELSYVHRATALFLIVWIFIGAYIIFNLFISILLSSFDDFGENDQEIIFPEDYPNQFQKYELAELEYHKKLEKQKKKKENSKEEHEEDDEEKEMGNSEMIDIGVDHEKNGYLKEWQLINTVYKDNYCERSLFVLPQTNRFRLYCMGLITWKRFDQLIMVVILVSTLRLMLDTFIDGALSSSAFDIADIIFTMIFICEMVLKVISLGFIMDEGSYLRDNWNRIDFLIVIVSLIDLENLVNKLSGSQAGSGALGFLKVLRLLRTLRPLRFISKNVQLKLIITSLFDSIEAIMGVLAIVMVIFFAFSIVGMNLFYDLYMTCYEINEPYNQPILTFKDDLVMGGIATDDYAGIYNYVILN